MNKIKDIYHSKLGWKILIRIKYGAVHPTDIASNMMKSIQVISKYLKNLEEENLIKRKNGEGRKTICKLRPRGRKLAEYAVKIQNTKRKIDKMESDKKC